MIKKEIDSITDDENNLLKNAPHTQEMITMKEWDFPYTRKQAVFPIKWIKSNKYWPSVRRINEVQGDQKFNMFLCIY